jgi:hypothetical protein
MNLEKRLRALESGGITDPVILHFADGSTRRISGGQYLVELLSAATGRANVLENQHLNWVRECVAAHEPGGGHMIEVLKVIFHGPATSSDQQMVSGNLR